MQLCFDGLHLFLEGLERHCRKFRCLGLRGACKRPLAPLQGRWVATLLLSGGFKNGTSQAPARSLHGLTATIAIIGCALNADIGSWLDMTAWRRRDAEIDRA